MAGHELRLSGGTVHLPGGGVQADVFVSDGRIAAIGGTHDAARTLDCTGLDILPGVIDTQVHFREPGLIHKEDLESGSRAAVLGGVTAVFEMPNTKPNTDSAEAIADKLARAHHRMWCDHAFYVGATSANAELLGELERLPGTAGVKIFMGASTGDLLVAEDGELARVLAHGSRRVAIHAEDEDRMEARLGERVAGDPASHPVWRDDESAILATRRILKLARAARRRVHILHVTTPDELELIAQHRDIATCEVTPQHLTLAGEQAYPALGTLAQMNPPIRSAAHRAGLWHWLRQGVPDVIGSDHAPHTREEKAKPYPESPSGMPGVQTLLPLLLDHVANGRLRMARMIDLTSAGAQRVFGIVGKGRIAVGYDADFTVVDLKARWTIDEAWLASRCGWSPFTGMELTGRPVGTIVRGAVAMWDGALGEAATGEPIRFEATETPGNAAPSLRPAQAPVQARPLANHGGRGAGSGAQPVALARRHRRGRIGAEGVGRAAAAVGVRGAGQVGRAVLGVCRGEQPLTPAREDADQRRAAGDERGAGGERQVAGAVIGLVAAMGIAGTGHRQILQFSVASSVISALSSFEIGQPAFASAAMRRTRRDRCRGRWRPGRGRIG